MIGPVRKLGVVLGAVLGVVALVAAAAYACTPQARITTNPARAEAGAVVDLQGSLFEPNGNPINIRWGAADGPILAVAQADEAGGFVIPVTIPGQVPKKGYYLIQAQQLKPDGGNFWVASVAFEVTAVDPRYATPPPAAAPGEQPQAEVEAVPSAGPSTELAADPDGAGTDAATQPARGATQVPAAVGTGTQPGRPNPATTDSAAGARRTSDQPFVAGPVALDADPAGGAPGPVEETVAPAESVQGPALQAPASPPAEPLVVADPAALGGPRTEGSGPSPWILVPMALLGLGLFGVASAIVVHDLRGRRVKADI